MPSLPNGRPLGATTPAHLSPTQAAQLAKVSRRTIMRAIEAQKLAAFRDNRNRWQISLEDLGNWAGAQWTPSGQYPSDAHSCPPTAHLSTQPDKDDPTRELVAARITIAQLEAQLDERVALVRGAEARAQAAEALANKLTDLLAARKAPAPALVPAPAPKRRRWWPWSRG